MMQRDWHYLSIPNIVLIFWMIFQKGKVLRSKRDFFSSLPSWCKVYSRVQIDMGPYDTLEELQDSINEDLEELKESIREGGNGDKDSDDETQGKCEHDFRRGG